MRQAIRICGFGGQGVITAAVILGRAATVFDGRIACQSQAYGPEARGGAARAEVIIADRPIGYPGVHQADILVAMSHEAAMRYGREVVPGASLIIDPDLVLCRDLPGQVYQVPSTRIAEELGNQVVANIIMLGALSALTGIVSHEAIMGATLASVPVRFKALNARALEAGIAAARTAL